MHVNETTRREFLTRLGIGALTIGALASCGKKEGEGGAAAACNDLTGLSDADKATRTSLKYVDKSVEAGKECKGCVQYVEPAGGAPCGTCKIVKGPISAGGWCSAFAAKPA